MASKVVCFPAARWAEEGAAVVADRVAAVLAERPVATLMLAGGGTPRPLYCALAGHDEVDWSRVHFFWGDERMVPPIHEDSNFRMAWESLLKPLGIGPNDRRVHPMLTDDEAPINAARYALEIRRFFDLTPREVPRFDVVLLGMGRDGHTASLFPGTAALAETQRLVVANRVPQQRTTRLTVTLPLLTHARTVIVMVQGASKAARLAEVLASGDEFPVQRVNPAEGELIWLVDETAASNLPMPCE